jgi:hypothetical protein
MHINYTRYAGFEVLTAVVMKSSIFWDITMCSPLKVNRRFGRICRLHLEGRRIGQTRNQHESRWQVTTRRYILEDRELNRLSLSAASDVADRDTIKSPLFSSAY